ncbi:DUF3850 domain-containing protein [Candidatus Falkowbacteria bacterium]|nr:DUF3850 domain-containing protein [Candidatus Falkowbacteria bacterium]
MTISKKCWPKYFEKILTGKKRFELRLADFQVNEGDFLLLREWDPKTGEYTGRETEKKVGYVVKTKDCEKFWSKKEIDKYGFQIIQIE